MKAKRWFEIYGSVCVVVMVACGGTDPDRPGATGVERLEISNRNLETGLAGLLLTDGAQTAGFEAYRVPGSVQLADGTVRDYEIVGRFFGPDGHTIVSVGEGDDIPEGWLPDSSADAIAPTTRKQIEGVKRAVQHLVTWEAGEVSDERDLLVALGSNIDDALGNPEIEAEEVGGDETGVRRQGLTTPCGYRHRLSVYRGSAVFVWDHTATQTVIFQDCGGQLNVVMAILRKNHGDGPYDNGMQFKEAAWGSKISSILTPRRCDHWGYHYSLFGHVCNQDTFIEMGMVLAGAEPTALTLTRICSDREGYRRLTGRDSYYRPTFSNVAQFIDTYGWGAGSSAGGSAGGEVSRTVKLMN